MKRTQGGHTHTTIGTKIIAGLMIPCMILYAVGCYSYQTVELEDAKEMGALRVETKDGRHFEFTNWWTADSLGNVTGSGIEYVESRTQKRQYRTTPHFSGTIPADSIAVLEADQFDVGWTVVACLPAVLLVMGIIAYNWDKIVK